MKNVAIIPARGGSKRLPRKNVLLFNGNPLIYYTMWFAQKSPSIDKVIVSTDDDEIASLCDGFPVEVIKRPQELATDTSPTSDVIVHALETLDKRKEEVDFITTLQVTNPLRERDLLEEPLTRIIENEEASSIVGVSLMPEKYGKIDQNGYFQPENYSFEVRSQDLTERYSENGHFYISRAETIRTSGSLFGSKALAHICDEHVRRADIDNAEDFLIAETLFNRQFDKFEYLL